jgi:hypothetical protein
VYASAHALTLFTHYRQEQRQCCRASWVHRSDAAYITSTHAQLRSTTGIKARRMITSAWRRLRRNTSRLAATKSWLSLRPVATSYELLPTSSTREIMTRPVHSRQRSLLYLCVLIFFVISGVSAGVIKYSYSDPGG